MNTTIRDLEKMVEILELVQARARDRMDKVLASRLIFRYKQKIKQLKEAH